MRFLVTLSYSDLILSLSQTLGSRLVLAGDDLAHVIVSPLPRLGNKFRLSRLLHHDLHVHCYEYSRPQYRHIEEAFLVLLRVAWG